MAKTTKTTIVSPTRTAAGDSGHPPPASEPSAMQHLRTLNFLLVKETKELREKTRQLRSELATVSADRCIEEGIQRDVCGVVVSSHLSSTAELCAALLQKAGSDLAAEKAHAAEMKSTLLKKAEDSAAKVCLAKKMMLDAYREKIVMERNVKLAVEERDLCRSELDEERNNLKYFQQVSAQNYNSMIAAGTAHCRRLEEQVKLREGALQYAMQDMDSLKRFLREKMNLIVELERENERVREDVKMREELLMESAINHKEFLEQQLSESRILFEEMKNRKEGEIQILKAEIESNSSKILCLEEKYCCLIKKTIQLTDEKSHLQNSVDELKEKKSTAWRNSKWLYPAATTVFAVVASFAFAARARAR